MSDELDSAIAARFQLIDDVPAPDTWHRITSQGTSPELPTAAPRVRLLAVAAAVMLVGGLVTVITLVGGGESSQQPSDSATRSSNLLALPEDPQEQWSIDGSGSFRISVGFDDLLVGTDSPTGQPKSIVGLDRSTGAERWRTTADLPLAPGDLVGLRNIDGALVAIITMFPEEGVSEELWIGLDPTNGEERWRLDVDDQSSGYFYASALRSLQRVQMETGIAEVLSAVDGTVLRTYLARGMLFNSADSGSPIARIDGTSVAFYDPDTFEQLVAPIEIGMSASAATDSGDAVIVLDETGEQLIAFDRDGDRVAELLLEPAETTPDDNAFTVASLTDLIADRPTVLVGGRIIELADDGFQVIGALDNVAPGVIEVADGRSWYSANRVDGGEIVGRDLIELPSGRTVMSFDGFFRSFSNGIVSGENGSGFTSGNTDDERFLLEAFGYDGEQLWEIVLPRGHRIDFVDGGFLSNERTEEGTTITFWGDGAPPSTPASFRGKVPGVPTLNRLPDDPQLQWSTDAQGTMGPAIVIDDLVVVVHMPGDGPWSFVGLDRASGAERWRTTPDRPEDHGDIVSLYRVDGSLVADVYGGVTDRIWIGIDHATGQERWQRDIADDEFGEVDGDGYTYYGIGRTLLRGDDETGAVEVLSPVDGSVLRSVQSSSTEGGPRRGNTGIRVDGKSITRVDGTSIEIYDSNTLEQVVSSIDIGMIPSAATDVGDVVMVLDSDGKELIAFDRGGELVASLDVDPPASALVGVVADRPTVLIGTDIVELADGVLRLVAEIEAYTGGPIEVADGRTWFYARSEHPDLGSDVIELSTGEIVIVSDDGLGGFENGVLTGRPIESDRVLYEAFDYRGESMWQVSLPGGFQTNIVDGGIVTMEPSEAGMTFTFWE